MAGKLTTLLLLASALVQVSVGEICKSAGKQCSKDCSQVLFCLNEGSESVLVETCPTEPGSQVCSAQTKKCDANTCAGDPSEMPYICTGIGIYPDVQKCTNYYTCLKEGQPPQSECVCENTQYFHPPFSGCKNLPDSSTQCADNYEQCDLPGKCKEILAWSGVEKTGYAYICAKLTEDSALYPLVFSCPGTFTESSCTCSGTTGNSQLNNKEMADLSGTVPGTCNPYIPPTNVTRFD